MLLLDLLLFCQSSLLLLLSLLGDFSERFVQIVELDGNHKVEDEEGTEDDRSDEEQVPIHVPSVSISHLIHHVTPAFKRDQLKLCHHCHPNIIPMLHAYSRVLPLHAFMRRWAR